MYFFFSCVNNVAFVTNADQINYVRVVILKVYFIL